MCVKQEESGFIESTDYLPTDPTIIFQRFGNRKTFIFLNANTARKTISVFHLFDK